MYRRLPLALAAMLASAADLTIDHATIAGKNLKAMQARLADMGLPSEYGGLHNNRATEMALTAFPDGSYLELIAPQPQADAKALAAHPWARWMEADAGPCAWAVRSAGIAAEVRRLTAAGVAVGAPVRSGRHRPDGVALDWETAGVGAEPNGTFFPFLIRDLTNRKLRAFPQGKPTTKEFTGITRVVIAVRDLADSAARYRQAYALQLPRKQVDASFGAQLALLGGTPVILAAPLGAQSWLAERLERFGEGPCAFILGAKRPDKLKAAAKTRWFGADIFWFDTGGSGWHLGFE